MMVTQGNQLGLGEVVDSDVATDSSGFQGFGCTGLPDAEDVGECDLQTLVARKINTNEACHVAVTFQLSVRCLPCFQQGCAGRSWTAKVSGVKRPQVCRFLGGALAFVQGWRPTLWAGAFTLLSCAWPGVDLWSPRILLGSEGWISPDAACAAGCRK